MKRAVLVVFPNERYLETCYCNFIPLSPPDTEYFSSKFTACSSVSVCSVKCFLIQFYL